MATTIEKINKEALGNVGLAQLILNKIIANPQLNYVQDPVLSKMGKPRWNRHFVMETLYEFTRMYSTVNPNDVPEQVQNFVKDANKFLYGGSN